MPTTSLLELPPEIVLDVLEYLSPHDLRSCQLVNKQLFALIAESVVVQYKMALSMARAEDNPCSLASFSDKITELKSSEEAWATLTPKFTMSIPVRHHPSGIYDLTGGAYLLGNSDRKTLHYLKLPRKPEDDKSWRSVKVDRTIIDMGLCVFEHDLIAIVTTRPQPQTIPAMHDIELTLREFSSGQRHPQAKEERILVMTSPYEKPAIGIEIVGDSLILILTFYHYQEKPEDRVFIYEWRTSVLKASFSAPWRTYSGLIFLSEHLALLPNNHANALDIFRIPLKPTIETLAPVLTLCLPNLADGRSLSTVSCRAEPNPIGAASRLDKRQRAQELLDAGIVDVDDFHPTRGFLVSSADAICVFAVRVHGIPVGVLNGAGVHLHFPFANTFTLITHRQSFLDLVQQYDGAAEPIPWAEWGPPVSRWFNADTFPTRWITTTAGQRCVLIAETAPETGFPYVVLDFNKDNVKRMKKQLAEENETPEPSPAVEVNHLAYEDEAGLVIDEEDLEIEFDEAAALFGPSPEAGPDPPDAMEVVEDDEVEYQDSELESDSSSENAEARRPSRFWCVETSEQIEAPETFTEEVSGDLPYVAAASEGRYAFDGVLLDEERVIGIRTDIMDDIRHVDVHYFGAEAVTELESSTYHLNTIQHFLSRFEFLDGIPEESELWTWNRKSAAQLLLTAVNDSFFVSNHLHDPQVVVIPPMLHFFDLPTEIFIEILSYLHFLDLHRCLRVCHLLNDTIEGSLHIQYQMQLQLAGMQSNPYSKACVTSRLELLKVREEAWRTFDWNFVTNVTVPYQSSGVYDLTPSVYLLGKTSSGDVFETTGIQSVRLPAKFPDDLETVSVEWNEFNFGMHIVDFGTAIEEHDLVACVSSVPDEDDRNLSHIVVVLLRYSTKRTHDDCQNPVIPICRIQAAQGQPSISIEVVGENLALTVVFNQDAAMSSDYLYIYDWKTGRSKCDPIQVYNIGLVFLREDILVNPNIVRKSLDLYHIPPSSALSSPTASVAVRLLQSLLLPSLKPGQRVTSISCRSNPNPTANCAFPKYARPTRPYANDPSDAIMIMTLEVSPFARGSSRNYVMIIHRRALLGFALSSLKLKSHKGQLSLLTWDAWGPAVTRWFNADDFSTVFITATSGQRYVQLTPSERGQPRGANIPLPRDTIHVLDFNPWHVHRARRNPDPKQLIVGGVEAKEGEKEPEENICQAHEAFKEDIISRLPYVRCTSEEKWEFYDAILMDEERVLGVSSEADSYRMEAIDVIYLG